MRPHRNTNDASPGEAFRCVLCWLIAGLVLLIYAGLRFNWSAPPEEDAAMLMRYADHLGHGHGFVWNIGEEPVDGATDFLLTILLGALVSAGLEVTTATRLVTITTHVLLVSLLAWQMARQKVPLGLRISLLLFAAIGGGLVYAEACFGTSLFALLALVSWISVLELRARPDDLATSALFAFAALLTGLARPEGVFLCLLMWAALAWWYRSDPGKIGKTSAIYFGVMLILGGAYFLGRWSYFGYPLPNPFYIKGAGAIYPSSLMISLASVLAMALPLLPFLALASKRASSRRQLVFLAIPVLGFAGLWILMTDEMNYFMRFQYCLFPIVLASWYPIVASLPALRKPDDHPGSARPRLFGIRLGRAVFGLYVVGALLFQDQLFAGRARQFDDGREQVGKALEPLAGKGYALATAEAGLLPFASQWTSLDLWGLNDKRIAHQGLDFGYLDEFRPAVVMYHANKSPLDPVQRPSSKPYALRWAQMIDTIDSYVASRPYRLAAAFGVQPHEAHYYFVRSDLADSARLFQLISSVRYSWPQTGEIARDLSRDSRAAIGQTNPDQ